MKLKEVLAVLIVLAVTVVMVLLFLKWRAEATRSKPRPPATTRAVATAPATTQATMVSTVPATRPVATTRSATSPVTRPATRIATTATVPVATVPATAPATAAAPVEVAPVVSFAPLRFAEANKELPDELLTLAMMYRTMWRTLDVTKQAIHTTSADERGKWAAIETFEVMQAQLEALHDEVRAGDMPLVEQSALVQARFRAAAPEAARQLGPLASRELSSTLNKLRWWGRARAQDVIAALEELSLSDEQHAPVKQIAQTMLDEIEALPETPVTDETRDADGAQLDQIIDRAKTSLSAVLTPRQKQQTYLYLGLE